MKFRVILAVLAVLSSDARLQVREVEEPKDPAEMADSETIEGPDCGHVKQIIGKWAKAKKAGGLSGTAKGTVDNGARAEEYILDKMLPRAEAIGEEIGDDGEMPASIKGPVAAAKDKVKAITSATTELDNTLSSFKDKVGESEFSAKKVASEDMATLKEQTEKTNEAIKAAYEAGERAISKANEAKETALKDSGKALKIIKSVYKSGKSAVDESKEIAQKSGHAIDEAEETVEKASAIKDKVEEKGADAGDQEPVFEALASNIGDRSSSVDDAKESLSQAISDLDTIAGELGEKVDSLKEASEKGDAGDTNAVRNEAGEIPKAEGQVDETTAAISTVKGRAKTLIERTERLKDIMKKAEKKVA